MRKRKKMVSSKNVYKIDQIIFEFANNADPEKSYLFVDTKKFLHLSQNFTLLDRGLSQRG